MRRPDGSGTDEEITSKGDFFWYEWIEVNDERLLTYANGELTLWALNAYWTALAGYGFYDNHVGSVVLAERNYPERPGWALLACWATLGTRGQLSLTEAS